MTSRTPCKFFQQGNCFKGNNCKFAHIKSGGTGQWGGNNSFGTPAANDAIKYNETSIKTDMTTEKPVWDLSIYGPAKEEPNMIVGTDLSPEEDRVKYYQCKMQTGNEAQYLQEREQLVQRMNQQVTSIANDTTGAIKHFNSQKSKTNTGFGGSSTSAPFEPFIKQTSGFGSGGSFGNNAFGNRNSTFGMGGTNTQPQTSAFGGGNAFGSTGNATPAFGSTGFQKAASAFGNLSQSTTGGFGSNTTSAFGAAPPSSTPAFGATSRPSAFGGASNTSAFGAQSSSPAFGATSSMGGIGGAPAFGSTSAFGAAAQPSTAMGMTGNTSTPAFGASSALGSSSAFGANAQSTGAPQGFGSFAGAATGVSPGFGASAAQPQSSNTNQAAPASSQEAFNAPTFLYRMIPEQEPPIELR
ncbi:hypothetical protein VKS41_005207 [Umbelopsis sp. WA50703]